MKLPARHLMPGDQTGSGETIVSVSAGIRTPRGKVEVTLEKDGRRRTSLWGAGTNISVSRPAAPATPVTVKIKTLGLILADLAATALSGGSDVLAGHDAALISNLTTLQLICSTLNAERMEVRHQP